MSNPHHQEDGAHVLGMSAQVLGFVELVTAGGILLVIAIVSLVCITLILLVAVFLSPVLVPLGGLLLVGITFTLTSGGVAIAVASAVSWGYHYFVGRHPPVVLRWLLPHDDIDEAFHRSHVATSA